MPNTNAAAFRWLWLSLGVIVADQLTKLVIVSELHVYQIVEIFPVFNLTLTYNKGAAFSFLADAAGWQRWFFSSLTILITTGLIIWLKNLREQVWEAMSIALIIGGALGNLIDRLRLGAVIDFIMLHWQTWYFPAFNVADAAITIGAVLMILDNLFSKPEHR